MEKSFGEFNSGSSYLLCNLNAIQTASHLLALLSEIEKRYSLAGLRTQNLSDKIGKLARSVLVKLFYPEQMKFQLRQVDLMNRDSLYYLERLDAFEIMETHIMDRVM